jgi:hypothetical protein
VKYGGRTPSPRGSCVRQDWHAGLPDEKARIFGKHEHHLESLYNMFSVSLNEAIELRHGGLLAKSLMAIGMSSELCTLLTLPLAGMLRALHEHAKHYGTIPNAAPLDPANYQGSRSQCLARMSGLLSRVLFSHRLQFLQKVGTLEEMVEDLDRDFRTAAEDLACGVSLDPERMWNEVRTDHYDLNTCLRETIILLKSFLVVLPLGQLRDFQNTVYEQSQVPAGALAARERGIRHRRMAPIAGQ